MAKEVHLEQIMNSDFIANSQPIQSPCTPQNQALQIPKDNIDIGKSYGNSSLRYGKESIPEYKIMIKEIFHLIENGIKEINCNEGEVVLVCGRTGSGKSTLINYLIGNELKTVKLPNKKIPAIEIAHHNQNSAKIGHGDKSETFIPQKFLDKERGVAYWDCPGFEDTRGAKYDIANAFYVNKIFSSAKAKVLAVVEESALTGDGRGQVFKSLIANLYDMFGDAEKLSDSMVLVFTKSVNIENFRAHLTNIVNEDNKLTSEHRAVLQCVINRSAIAVFNQPMMQGVLDDEDRQAILQAISKVSYVHHEEINFLISHDSLRVIADMLEWYHDSVASSMSSIAEELQPTGSDLVKIADEKLASAKYLHSKLTDDSLGYKDPKNWTLEGGILYDTFYASNGKKEDVCFALKDVSGAYMGMTMGNNGKTRSLFMSNDLSKDRLLLPQLQALKHEIEVLRCTEFSSDFEILDFIEDRIVPNCIEFGNGDLGKVRDILAELRSGMKEIFEGFFKKFSSTNMSGKELRIQPAKFTGIFVNKMYFPLEKTIVSLIYKGNQAKIEEMNQKLETQKQESAAALQKETAKWANEKSALQAQLSSVSSQYQSMSNQYNSLSNQYKSVSNELGEYKVSVENLNNHINNLNSKIKYLESIPPIVKVKRKKFLGLF
jgi:energy-coupling factor transporter ATP-binding protein EcfA2